MAEAVARLSTTRRSFLALVAAASSVTAPAATVLAAPVAPAPAPQPAFDRIAWLSIRMEIADIDDELDDIRLALHKWEKRNPLPQSGTDAEMQAWIGRYVVAVSGTRRGELNVRRKELVARARDLARTAARPPLH